MRRHLLLAVSIVIGASAPAFAQPSVQRCIEILRSRTADAGLSELCQGTLAANGTNGPQDQQSAFQHYRRAAELGNADGQALLGAVYQNGWAGIARDIGLAVSWYQKAVQQGHAGAQLNLGLLYEKGDGVPRDAARARSLIETAARQGLAPAQRKLAEMDRPKPITPGTQLWEEGKKRYLAGDHATAAQYILKAAQAGNGDAQNQIGYMYEAGDGVTRSAAEAAKWYQTGAAQGHAHCQFALGSLLEQGRGVKENWDEAAQWFQKSAAQADDAGMFSLGRAYEYGIGVPVDLSAAITWYDKAAAKGHGQAAFFAKYLRDNHGQDGSSRTPEEQALLGPLLQRYVFTAPPIGQTFHSSTERIAYVRAVAQDEKFRSAQMFWNMAKAGYDACVSANRRDCHSPGPPPARR